MLACCALLLQPEVLEKHCESCGAANARHTLTHAIWRLPRVLVVHIKRFQVRMMLGGHACL